MAKIKFSNNINLEYGVNNEYTLKHSRYPTLYLSKIENVADRLVQWTLADQLSEVEEIELKDFIAMKKEVLIQVKDFFERGFVEYEEDMKKSVKKAAKKKGKK